MTTATAPPRILRGRWSRLSDRSVREGGVKWFPDAGIAFDRFHVAKLLNDAVEKVRRTEQKGHPELKRSRWLWNPERMTRSSATGWTDSSTLRGSPSTLRRSTGSRWLQEFWDLPPELARLHLEVWCPHAEDSGLQPMASRLLVTDGPGSLLTRRGA